MWTDFFDQIYVINLPRRSDRRKAVIEELDKYAIPFTIWPATEDENGALGLFKTVKDIFQAALTNGWNNILLLEDDIHIMNNVEGLHFTMESSIKSLPKDYDLLYLGVNPSRGFSKMVGNLLPIKGGYSSHAIAYSRKAMQEIMDIPMRLPYDSFLVEEIQRMGNSYCTFPMLISQRDGFSDIEKREVQYAVFLENKYATKISELQKKTIL